MICCLQTVIRITATVSNFVNNSFCNGSKFANSTKWYAAVFGLGLRRAKMRPELGYVEQKMRPEFGSLPQNKKSCQPTTHTLKNATPKNRARRC